MLTRLLSELKRRKVTNVAVAYAVVGTGVAEAVNMVSAALSLPDVLFRGTVVAILVGFPGALALAWFYRVSPEVAERTVPGGEAAAPRRPVGWGSFAGWALAGLLLCVMGWRALASRDAVTTVLAAVSDVEAAMSGSDWIRAHRLADELPEGVPDAVRSELIASATIEKELQSDPPGARVSWRPYGQPDANWEPIGQTPVRWNAPRAAVALRFEHEGYVPRTVAVGLPPYLPALPQNTRLRREGEPLSHALHMQGGLWLLSLSDSRLASAPRVTLDPYLMDRSEVTNREYQSFVDAGGYQNAEYWVHPIVADGDVVSWEEAAGSGSFLDRTDRPGPSTWVGGTYPEGMDDHPVAGVSWYEAAAYARFVGRELPTLQHWWQVARTFAGEWPVPHSNFEGEGTWPVGQSAEVSPEGAYDMAGNVREWVVNATDELKITVGGGWNDARWLFSYAHPQPPLDRSATNGFRLMTHLGSPENLEAAGGSLEFVSRDYTVETPVSEEVFETFREQLSYDQPPLGASIVEVDTTDAWIRERVQFDAGYAGEPMLLHLFRPLAPPARPLQAVVYVPANFAQSVDDVGSLLETDPYVRFLVRSGRAVALPAVEGLLERRYPSSVGYSLSNEYRDKIFHQRADLGRSLDYLGTRPEIDSDAFGYFGVSSSAVVAPIHLAVEPRLRAAALVTVGLSQRTVQQVVDPLHYLPRVRVPVLMMNGAYDRVIAPEAARPFYDLLGTDEADKKLVELAGTHAVPVIDTTRETLEWLDRHLGEVR